MQTQYYSPTQAANKLGVTIQTLRNWDESGTLKAERTSGKHRRYPVHLIDNFNKPERINCSFWGWQIKQNEYLYQLALTEASKDPRAKECGGFTKEQVGLLFKNQDVIHDGKDNVFPQDFLYSVLKEMSFPYLFNTKIMTHPIMTISYKRVKSSDGKIADCEFLNTEEIRAIECGYDHIQQDEYLYSFSKLAKKFDEILMNRFLTVKNEVYHHYECKYDEISNKIHTSIEAIDKKTNANENKIIIQPPELSNNKKTEKLNNNLFIQNCNYGENVKTYISRLIPQNMILVGTKSENGLSGFTVCPYTMMGINENKIFIRIARKLFPHGNEHYALITVK